MADSEMLIRCLDEVENCLKRLRAVFVERQEIVEFHNSGPAEEQPALDLADKIEETVCDWHERNGLR